MNTGIENNTVNAKITHCPNCEHHCPIDAVRCGKGGAFAEKLKNGETDYAQNWQEQAEPMNYAHGGHDGHRHHGNEGKHDRHSEHGHGRGFHDGHGRYRDDGSLSSLFHRCMHVVHHTDGQHSGQGRILHILAKEGELTQRELQERLMIQAGSLSELVTKLETKGMLVREQDENDKRKVRLKITSAGFDAATQSPGETRGKDPFAALTAEEQDTLRGLLTKLLENNAK